jgi:hypothetical protein
LFECRAAYHGSSLSVPRKQKCPMATSLSDGRATTGS